MYEDTAEKAARDFTASMIRHHKTQLASKDEEIRNAVIVKMVALVSLAFGIPPIRGESLDANEAMAKLKIALEILDGVSR
jgi:hypothetical protein